MTETKANQEEPQFTELDLENAGAAADSMGADFDILFVPYAPGTGYLGLTLRQSGTLEIILQADEGTPAVYLQQPGSRQIRVPLGASRYEIASNARILYRPEGAVYRLAWRFL